MLLGGYRKVDPSQIEELPYYNNVVRNFEEYLTKTYSRLSTFETNISIEQAFRQLVNGLNYKVDYKVDISNSKCFMNCQVKWYAPFRGTPDKPTTSCSYNRRRCPDLGRPTRKRRSLSELNSYPKPSTMQKHEHTETVESLFEIFNFHFNRTYRYQLYYWFLLNLNLIVILFIGF